MLKEKNNNKCVFEFLIVTVNELFFEYIYYSLLKIDFIFCCYNTLNG